MAEMRDVEQATKDVLASVHDVTDRMLGPDIARAVLLRTAAVMIAKNLGDDELSADAVNQTWAERRFGWRMVRVQ